MVRDRRHLSAEGIVVPVVVLDKQTGRLESRSRDRDPRLRRGERGADLLEEAGRLVAETVESRPARGAVRPGAHPRARARELRRFFRKRAQRRPMVIPVVMEV